MPTNLSDAFFLLWIASVLVGASIASQRQSALGGFLLGLLFGPLGVLAAGFLDARPKCSRCGGRQNGTPDNPYPICEHCGTENPQPIAVQREMLRAQRREELQAAGLLNRSLIADTD
jgi:hypothetical protein